MSNVSKSRAVVLLVVEKTVCMFVRVNVSPSQDLCFGAEKSVCRGKLVAW